MKNLALCLIFALSLFALDLQAQTGRKKSAAAEDTIVRTKKKKFKFEEMDGEYYEPGSRTPYTGYYIHYRNNGKLDARGYLKNGVKEGVWKYCFKNGNSKAIESFVDGHAHGVWIEFDRNGDVRNKLKYDKGELVEKWDEAEAEALLAKFDKKEPKASKYRHLMKRAKPNGGKRVKPEPRPEPQAVEEPANTAQPEETPAPANNDSEVQPQEDAESAQPAAEEAEEETARPKNKKKKRTEPEEE